jgi:hypothetical protein
MKLKSNGFQFRDTSAVIFDRLKGTRGLQQGCIRGARQGSEKMA